jgi:type IV pilus assembly protein PilA
MILARKAELEKDGKKGFTLMEMLIVVAIIAVLVAIAIPVFTTQLNSSKQSADEANARSIYSEVAAAYMTGEDYSVSPATLDKGGDVVVTVTDSKGTASTTTYSFSDATTSFKFTDKTTTTGPTVEIKTNGATKSWGN